MRYPVAYIWKDKNKGARDWAIIGYVTFLSRGPKRIFVMGHVIKSNFLVGCIPLKDNIKGSFKHNFNGEGWNIYEGVSVQNIVEEHFVELL